MRLRQPGTDGGAEHVADPKLPGSVILPSGGDSAKVSGPNTRVNLSYISRLLLWQWELPIEQRTDVVIHGGKVDGAALGLDG